MKWFWWCFDAVSYDANDPAQGNRRLFRLKDKTFATEVSHEHGNYDYLMADDLDMGNEFVRGEVFYWGDWFLKTTGVDGFRLDACKHIPGDFFPGWLGTLRASFRRQLFSVGEYWSDDVDELHGFISETGGSYSLFDVPLHYRFREASVSGNSYDMRTILDRTLMKEQPRWPSRSSTTTTRSPASRWSRGLNPGSSRSPTRSFFCAPRDIPASSTPTTTSSRPTSTTGGR